MEGDDNKGVGEEEEQREDGDNKDDEDSNEQDRECTKESMSSTRPFEKRQCVEYRNADGTWEPADVVDVGYDEELVPFYMITLPHRNGQEKGTVHSRLRSPLASSV